VVIDEWMANLEANPRLSVEENRPAAAVDSRFDSDGNLIYAGSNCALQPGRGQALIFALHPFSGRASTLPCFGVSFARSQRAA